MTGNGSYVNLMSSSKLVFLAGFSNKEPLYSAVWVVYLHPFNKMFFAYSFLQKLYPGQVWSMTFALLALVFLTCCHVFCVALQKLRANVVAPAAANNLSGTTRTILVDNGEGVLIYEDDVVSKEVRSAARTPFADPNFLQAIGSSFLERVTKNNEQADKEVR